MGEIKNTVSSEGIPGTNCPVCTRDLDADGWCFECREYRRPKEITDVSRSISDICDELLEIAKNEPVPISRERAEKAADLGFQLAHLLSASDVSSDVETIRHGVGEGFPRVRGKCPMGCGETLFLGAGGYVTCSYLPCPNPGAASDRLAARAAGRENVTEAAREKAAAVRAIRDEAEALTDFDDRVGARHRVWDAERNLGRWLVAALDEADG